MIEGISLFKYIKETSSCRVNFLENQKESVFNLIASNSSLGKVEKKWEREKKRKTTLFDQAYKACGYEFSDKREVEKRKSFAALKIVSKLLKANFYFHINVELLCAVRL